MFLFLDSVDFGWTSVADVGETLGEQTSGASLSFSHTFGWEMCVGIVTEVSNRNLIHCRKQRHFARQGPQPEVYK